MRFFVRKGIGFILWVCGVILAATLQIGFVSSLPFPLSSVNVLVGVVILLTILRGVRGSLPWAVGSGLLYDLYVPWGYGVSAWSLYAVAIAVSLCGRHIFTNRSFFSLLARGVVGCMTYAVVVVAMTWLYQFLSLSVWSWVGVPVWEWMVGQMVNLLAVESMLAVLYVSFRRTVWDVTILDGTKAR